MCDKHIIHFVSCGHEVISYQHCDRHHNGEKYILLDKKIEVVPDFRERWACPEGCGNGYTL
jgi:hypothetical protein